MIVGGYTLDLYCRFDRMSSGPERGTVEHPWRYMPHCFAGNNERDCMAQARRRGWVFSKGDATCPKCAKEGRKA